MRFEYSTIVAALAVSAQAQTRNLIGYIGSNTGCGPGNVIAYDNVRLPYVLICLCPTFH
jgi:hypothetical protein